MDTLDNVAISLPNSDVTGSSVNNYSREPMRRVDMYFSAAYSEPTEKVKAAILEAVAQDARIVSDPAPFVRLFEYKGSVVSYVLRVWCKNADYWDVYFNLNENVRASFADKGVKFSYEHVNVHIVEDKT
jgi:small conductance mechanosensitive channel